jgi:hypothetical protein
MAAVPDRVDVVLVADVGDPHQLCVDAQLQALGARTLRLNLSDLVSRTLVSRIGALDVAEGTNWSRVDHATTVWWFRPGQAHVEEGTAADEAQLIADEAPAVLIGSFRAAGVRWVDDPDVIRRAEWKLSQLAVAASLKLPTPRWTVTNSPTAAQQFADGHPVIAKPLSAGRGIAPYVATVPPQDLAHPGDLATLLQHKVEAAADIRVVIVNGQMWTWRRAREPDTVDWRAVDPGGRDFSPVPPETMGMAPGQITSALGLTMSVQDWLETENGPVFLEANPQGTWSFLDGADPAVGAAIAHHLRYRVKETAGTWPEARRRAFFDFLTKERAPANDGLIAPRSASPIWADEVARVSGAVEVAKSAREAAEDAAKVAEDKASRLVQVTLALLTVGLALGSYQLTFALERSWPWLFLLIPIATALACLAIAAFEGVLIDRVGFYYQPSGADLSSAGQRDPNAILLAQEERGRRLARWSANHKHTDLMQARAWFTRGLAALLLAGLLAGICRATASAAAHRSHTTRQVTPTAQPSATRSPSPRTTDGSGRSAIPRHSPAPGRSGSS